ncbi:MAG: hypothetical protein BYD32DRAFT_403919 [Podila humilis]|nr:MAG: hypothetical protein BYD32DRAFT_403919 [Podila humilis]
MASLSDNDKKLDMDTPAIPYNVTPYQSYSSSPPASTSSPKGTDIPVSRPSPFGASFAGPSINVARFDSTPDQTQPLNSYYRTPSSSSTLSSSSCGSNRHATRAAHKEERNTMKALEKSVKHEKKLLAREESQLAKTAKREAKALRKEVEHHAKVLTKELKNSAQETVASMKRSLRDKLYDYEQQWQGQQHQQQHYHNDRDGYSCSTHKTHPWSPSQPIMAPMPPPPEVPHAFAPPHMPQMPPAPLVTPTLHHHSNSRHVAKQQRKLDKHLTREQKRQMKIEYKQQRKVDRLVRRDCHRNHHHNPPHSFPIRVLGGVIFKGLNMLMNDSSSQHPPQRAITVAPPPLSAPLPPPAPTLPPHEYSSSSSSPSHSRSQPKSIGPQEPVLVYSMTHMSLNHLSAPSAPALPSHHEPTSVALAVPRPDLELYHHDEDELDTNPPPSYESATRA